MHCGQNPRPLHFSTPPSAHMHVPHGVPPVFHALAPYATCILCVYSSVCSYWACSMFCVHAAWSTCVFLLGMVHTLLSVLCTLHVVFHMHIPRVFRVPHVFLPAMFHVLLPVCPECTFHALCSMCISRAHSMCGLHAPCCVRT